MKKLLSAGVLCLFSALPMSALAASMYSVLDLGDLPGGADSSSASDINTHGDVVGSSDIPGIPDGSVTSGFLWTDEGGLQGLPPPGPNAFTRATGINNSREIIGYGGTVFGFITTSAFLLRPESSGFSVVASVPLSAASDVNELGEVAGIAGNLAIPIAALWTSSGGPTILGSVQLPSTASAINDLTHIVGNSSGTDSRAFLWTSQADVVDLGDLGRGSTSTATDINNDDDVVGASGTAGSLHAFLWNAEEGMRDLGDLPGGADNSLASGINALDQVVGTSTTEAGERAFLWEKGALHDLNDLIDALDPSFGFVTLTSAVAINDAGQIAATGIDSRTGATHAYRLSPIRNPEEFTFYVSPTTVRQGATTFVTWTGVPNATAEDRIGLYQVVGKKRQELVKWQYLNCSYSPGVPASSGSCGFVMTDDLHVGKYEVQLLHATSYDPVATSGPIVLLPRKGNDKDKDKGKDK